MQVINIYVHILYIKLAFDTTLNCMLVSIYGGIENSVSHLVVHTTLASVLSSSTVQPVMSEGGLLLRHRLCI